MLPDRSHTMRMADTLAAFRSMLARLVDIDEALTPYLGESPRQADAHADERITDEGLLTDRLKGLVTILALREAPPRLAMLAAALLWRSAPVATSVDELREAIVRICLWRSGMTDDDLARIADAHRTHMLRLADIMARTGRAEGPMVDELARRLEIEAAGDSVVAELGSSLLIIQMTADDLFVGLEDEDGDVIVIDRVPFDRGGRRDDGRDEAPHGPRPPVLQTA